MIVERYLITLVCTPNTNSLHDPSAMKAKPIFRITVVQLNFSTESSFHRELHFVGSTCLDLIFFGFKENERLFFIITMQDKL